MSGYQISGSFTSRTLDITKIITLTDGKLYLAQDDGNIVRGVKVDNNEDVIESKTISSYVLNQNTNDDIIIKWSSSPSSIIKYTLINNNPPTDINPTNNSNKISKELIIGLSVGGSILVILFIIYLFYINKQKKYKVII